MARPSPLTCLLPLALSLAGPTSAVQGGALVTAETQVLTPAAAGRFGDPCDIDGDVAVLQADARVFIYRRTAGLWSLEAELVPSAPTSVAFGQSIAIRGDVCVAGEPSASGGGAVYVFRRMGGVWVETDVLVASDTTPDLFFGVAVDIDGDRVIVGARGWTTTAPAAYVFVRTPLGWAEEGKLVANSAGYTDRFAGDVYLSGDLALVTAGGDTVGGLDQAGSAFVFRLGPNGWNQTARLVAEPPQVNGFCGRTAALEDGLVVLGSTGATHSGVNYAGAAYVFERNALGDWVQVQRLIHPHPRELDGFSSAVGLSTRRIVVGAQSDNFGGNWDCGSAHVYRCSQDGWVHAGQVLPLDTHVGQAFGTALGFDGHQLLIAADNLVVTSPHDGAVYAFTLQAPSVGSQTCPGVANSTGASAQLSAWGSDDASENALTIEARNLPPFEFGYLLASELQGFVQGPAGSQGNLCLAGNIARFVGDTLGSGASGGVCLDVDLASIPTAPLSTVVTGETWTFQYWYRDANPQPTSNFSNGLAIPFL